MLAVIWIGAMTKDTARLFLQTSGTQRPKPHAFLEDFNSVSLIGLSFIYLIPNLVPSCCSRLLLFKKISTGNV